VEVNRRMTRRSVNPIVTVLIALGGQIAVVILLTDAFASAPIYLFLIYGLWVPAWFFWDRIMVHAPQSSDTGKPWILLPVFLSFWAGIIVLVWIPVQSLDRGAVLAIILAVTFVSTGLLLWHSPNLTAFQVRKAWATWRRQILWGGLGVLTGGVLAATAAFGFNDQTLYGKPAGENSAFYFLPSQEISFWQQMGAFLGAGSPMAIGVGISNNEGMAGEYVIVVTQGGDRAIAEVSPIFLQSGEVWEGIVRLNTNPDGDRILYFLLERVGYPWPYRKMVIRW
jgi:hypothetical protein